MKFIKILVVLVASLLALALLAMLALVLFVDLNHFKPLLEKQAAKQQMELHISGDLTWSFTSGLGIHVGKFTLKPAVQNIQEPFQFDDLSVSVKLMPLLHQQIVVDHIVSHGEELHWHDDSSGNDTIFHNLLVEAKDFNLAQRAFPLHIDVAVETTQPQRQMHFSGHTQLSIDANAEHLHLEAVDLQLDDTQIKGAVDLVLGKIPFVTIDLAGTSLDLDHYFPPSETQSATKISTNQLPENPHTISHPASMAPSELIPVSSIQALPGNYHVTLEQLTVQHLQGRSMQLLASISREGILTLKQFSVQAYEGQLAMHGALDTHPALPDLTLDLSLKHLSLAAALKDYLQTETPPVSGDVNLDVHIQSRGVLQDQLIQNMNGNFSFHSDQLTLNNVKLTQSLNEGLLQLLQTHLPKLMSAENKTTLLHAVGKGVVQKGMIDNTSLTADGLCTHFNGSGDYNLQNHFVKYRMEITLPAADQSPACAEITPHLKDKPLPVLCDGSLDNGAAKICKADQSVLNALVKQTTREVLTDKLNQAIDKKFGKDGDSLKQLLKRWH